MRGRAQVTDQNGKINTEAQYPYTSGGGTSAGVCHAKPAHAVASGITGYANVTVGNETALKLAAHQHLIISVAIDASQQSFQFYEQGAREKRSMACACPRAHITLGTVSCRAMGQVCTTSHTAIRRPISLTTGKRTSSHT
jgi:hypothetical protein